MPSLSALAFRLRQRLRYGSRTPNSRDLELLHAANEGRLRIVNDPDDGTYRYEFDGVEISKNSVQRADFYLGLLTTGDRASFAPAPDVQTMRPSNAGMAILSPVTASDEPLTIYDRTSFGLQGGCRLGAALCRSAGGERFYCDYELHGVQLSGVIIQSTGKLSRDGNNERFRVWLHGPEREPVKLWLATRGIWRLRTVPNEDGTATRSEQLRQHLAD